MNVGIKGKMYALLLEAGMADGSLGCNQKTYDELMNGSKKAVEEKEKIVEEEFIEKIEVKSPKKRRKLFRRNKNG